MQCQKKGSSWSSSFLSSSIIISSQLSSCTSGNSKAGIYLVSNL